MQPGVQSPTCPCLLPVPKPNDSQIPDANSMMNSCSQCPSWTAVACAAAGLLTTISASVAAAHTLARGHTALRLTVRKSMHSVPELRARRSQVPPGAAADRTAHAVTSGCILLHQPSMTGTGCSCSSCCLHLDLTFIWFWRRI